MSPEERNALTEPAYRLSEIIDLVVQHGDYNIMRETLDERFTKAAILDAIAVSGNEYVLYSLMETLFGIYPEDHDHILQAKQLLSTEPVFRELNQTDPDAYQELDLFMEFAYTNCLLKGANRSPSKQPNGFSMFINRYSVDK